ncbi:YbjP/YqhG family protein [Winogradskyella psychrotolerans]|uniref:YbjP/YqhG family protein n=1 Tax=Winogradskyella psychrotolerans TaxID=1344585 RepID=UPI001C06901B|nr:YbjP/YqhG family protein [Winogradskyella psychrotolerans]MBU2927744.1 YbjP/YqhG family protein [Winogradskyella psychrotolerans]
MKNVRLILVLLLMVNCTTDSSDVLEIQDDLSPQTLNCVDDLPQVKITNQSALDFDLIIYGQDYSQLHTQSLSAAGATDWLELTNGDIIVVATNTDIYGQKIQLSILPCESIEIEIDEFNNLIIIGI